MVFGINVLTAVGVLLMAISCAVSAEEKVYFCVMDQVVGIQGDKKADTGRIASGFPERFKLTYTPPRLLTDGVDPTYTLPKIRGNVVGGTRPTDYYLRDHMAFSSGRSFVAKLSESNLGRFERDSAKSRATLHQQIAAAQAEPLIGSYLGYTNAFGTESLQFMARGRSIHGIAVQIFLVEKENAENAKRPLVGYLHYFTCEDF